MTRVPVPSEYDDRDVPLPDEASSLDYDDLRSVVGTPGRVAQVREDEDGRYVGVPEQYAADVADYLGTELPESESDGADDSEDDDGEPGTCEEVKTDGEVCGRDLPCPYHSDDSGGD